MTERLKGTNDKVTITIIPAILIFDIQGNFAPGKTLCSCLPTWSSTAGNYKHVCCTFSSPHFGGFIMICFSIKQSSAVSC